MSRAIVGLNNQDIIDMVPAAGSDRPIDGVSKLYSFVPTIKAVDLLRDAGWNPISAKQSRVRNVERDGFQRHVIRFAMDGLDIGEERVDLMLVNSHDRGCAFKLMASIWRKICANGLMTSSPLANFSHVHIGFSPDAFIESAKKIANHAGEIAGQVEDLKKIELTGYERSVFAGAAHPLIFANPDNAPINSEKLLQERRYDDGGKDLWTTFNVVQENALKGGQRGLSVGKGGKVRKTTTRQIKSIDRDIKLNQALWTLTEKMAELKLAA